MIRSSVFKKIKFENLARLSTDTKNGPVTPRDEYQPVPHYRQMSALYIKPPDPNEKSPKESVFPKVLSPELNLSRIFVTHDDMDKSSMSLNLMARHIHLNLNKLKSDFTRMRELETQIDRLEREKKTFTSKINSLIKQGGGAKNKKATLESPAVQELIRAGNEIKSRENKIMEELFPLAEIVNVACLRLPNNLHFSTLLLDPISASSSNEDRFKHVLFDMNTSQLDSLKKRFRREFNYGFDWRSLLNDSVEIYGVTSTAKYNRSNWSFVKESSVESIQNNRYLVGTYAKLEQSIVDYIHAKIDKLNDSESCDMPNFEHIKGVSMFKSAVVEGCGQSFTNTKRIFNVVRFSGPASAHPELKTDVELLHLTGAASLNSLVLGFIHTSIKPDYLPWTVYTNGKSYSPDGGQVNAFDLLTLTSSTSEYILENHTSVNDIESVLSRGRAYLDQIKTQIEDFARRFEALSQEELRKELSHAGKSIDEIFIDYLKLFVYVFKGFNIPIQFLCLNANQLRSSESFLIQVQAYLPSVHNYVTIGEVSLLNDYLSSRLQIRSEQGRSSNSREHVNMIYSRLVDINIFTQILTEMSVIRRYSGAETTGMVSLVVPSPLREFYHV